MIYELQPTNNQKSFYGKAKVEIENGTRVLYSYGTKILSINEKGEILRFWHGWSHTTGKHIKAFCGLNKKEYDALNFAE